MSFRKREGGTETERSIWGGGGRGWHMCWLMLLRFAFWCDTASSLETEVSYGLRIIMILSKNWVLFERLKQLNAFSVESCLMGDLACFSTVRNVCYVWGCECVSVGQCLCVPVSVHENVYCIYGDGDHDMLYVLEQLMWKDLETGCQHFGCWYTRPGAVSKWKSCNAPTAHQEMNHSGWNNVFLLARSEDNNSDRKVGNSPSFKTGKLHVTVISYKPLNNPQTGINTIQKHTVMFLSE